MKGFRLPLYVYYILYSEVDIKVEIVVVSLQFQLITSSYIRKTNKIAWYRYG